MKRFVFAVPLITLTLLLNGCITMQEIQASHQQRETARNSELIQRSEDHAMASEFYPSPFGPGYGVKVYVDSVVVGHRNPESGNNLNDMISRASRAADLSRDIVAQKYIEVSKNRGNIVKLYKPGLNQQVGQMFGRSDMFYAEVERRDLAPCLVEYDSKGRIITVLSRAQAFGKNLVTWDNYEMGYVYFGNTARQIENKIDNRAFEANFIAVL